MLRGGSGVQLPGGVTFKEQAGQDPNSARQGLKNGSSRGQNLALAVLCVPSSLDSGGLQGGRGVHLPWRGHFQGTGGPGVR